MHTRTRRALTLPDVVATLVALVILAMLAAAGLAETRRASQLDEAIGNLQRFARATEAYAADNAGQLWGFTWKGGQTHDFVDENGDVVEIRLPDDDLAAGAHQAISLIREIEGRVGDDAIPVPANWLPHVLYSHLPLMDYLGARILERWIVDPGDRNRLNWQDDPVNKFDEGFWLPLQPNPTVNNKRWPYSSSYRQVVAAWDAAQSDLKNGQGFRVQQGSHHRSWVLYATDRLFPASLDEVAYPAAKAHLHDTNQRHFGPRQAFTGLPEARIPVAMFDGSVSVRQSDDANPGWVPNSPTQPCDPFNYLPAAWEPETVSGEATDIVIGRYTWTRAGLKGVDFGGLPLDTGQSDPGECPF